MSSDFAFSELTPVSFLRRAAAVFGDRTAIVDGDFSCTYRDFWLRARQSADLLASAGVKPGDRVAILAPNSHLLLEAHYGVPLSGGVLVALNSRLAPAELAYILEHSGARIFLVDNEFAASAEAATNMLDDPPTVIGSEAHEQGLTGRPPLEVPVTDERSLLSINYTSGTTGRPKGVMYHHRGAYLQALAMALHAKLDVGSQYLWTLPMFHTNGWCFPWAVTAAGGVHRCLRSIDTTEIWTQSSRVSPISARRRRCCRCWCRRHPRSANAAIASVYSPAAHRPGLPSCASSKTSASTSSTSTG